MHEALRGPLTWICTLASLVTACASNGTAAAHATPFPDATPVVPAAAPVAPAIAAAPAAAKPPSQPDPQARLELAESCFADPECSAAEATKLLLQAADAGAAVDCDLLYFGVGVPVDHARARVCYERAAAAQPCQGSSPRLARLELSLMWLDGTGGPADARRARAILADCYQDGTVQAMSSLEPSDAARSICDTAAMTTLAMADCSWREVGLAERHLQLIQKHPALSSPEVQPKLVASRDALLRYASSHAAWAADVARYGTMETILRPAMVRTVVADYTERLAALAAGAFPSPVSDDAFDLGREQLRRTYEDARIGHDELRRAMLDRAQDDFVRYRDATSELYAAVGAKAQPDVADRERLRAALHEMNVGRATAIQTGLTW